MNRPITIAICLFITLALGVLLIWPKYQDLKLIQVEVEKKAAEFEFTEEYLSDLKKTSEDLKEYEEELSKIDFVLPQEFSPLDLLNYLQKVTAQSGLILTNFSLGAATPLEKNPSIKEHSLSLALSGFYPAFKNFLLTLEKSGRLIEIESFSFSSAKEKEPLSFNLTIKVYSY